MAKPSACHASRREFSSRDRSPPNKANLDFAAAPARASAARRNRTHAIDAECGSAGSLDRADGCRDDVIGNPADPLCRAEHGAVHRLRNRATIGQDKANERTHRIIEKARRIAKLNPLVARKLGDRFDAKPAWER